MPRNTSSSKPKPYSYSSPKSPISTSVPHTTPSIVHHNHQVQQPGFFSNMWQGFGLGAGQSIAFNMFRSDPVVKHVHEGPTGTIPSKINTRLSNEYVQCMKESQNNEEACKQYLEQK
jgi:hypothetical protein